MWRSATMPTAGRHIKFDDALLGRENAVEFYRTAAVEYLFGGRTMSGRLFQLHISALEVPMSAFRLRLVAGGWLATVLAGLLLLGAGAHAQEKKDKAKLDLDKIPKAVMDALKEKFPKAEILKWTKEKEGDDDVYDIEFKENGRACEADIKEDGTYINYEKAIEAKDLPKAVSNAVEKKYPKATLKEIMEETEVKGKDEKLSAYEVVLVTADKKEVELRLSPDGKILEDTGANPEEKK